MIRKQKVYEVGTLVSAANWEIARRSWHALSNLPAENHASWQNGIIIEKFVRQNVVELTDQLYYKIQWDSGTVETLPSKVLKGMVKSGKIKILSEG
jgi:hypothetical protein